jgi:hypothetical protein
MNMNLFNRFLFVTALGLGLFIGACDTTENSVRPQTDVGPVQANSSGPEVNIGDIWEQPHQYEGREVLVQGSYLGWRGQVAHPQITRSDWALQDETGSIYITGKSAKGLDPAQDIGRRLEVLGTVELNEKSVPYIRAEKVSPMDVK